MNPLYTQEVTYYSFYVSFLKNKLLLVAARGLPFGGIGQSGCMCLHVPVTLLCFVTSSSPVGYQTGKYAFDAFTHLKASIESPSW